LIFVAAWATAQTPKTSATAIAANQSDFLVFMEILLSREAGFHEKPQKFNPEARLSVGHPLSKKYIRPVGCNHK